MILWAGRKDGAAALRLHGLCAGAEGSLGQRSNVPVVGDTFINILQFDK